MKKFFLATALLFLCMVGLFAVKTQAAQLELTIDSSDGSNGTAILDDDYNTTEPFDEGTTITLQADAPIDSVYIKWDAIPAAWTLTENGTPVSCGQNGFLHEFVKLSATANEVTITVPNGGVKIADVYAFSAGDLPDFVQQWQTPWEKADVLFISTHADDEVLFFGGMIPILTNEDRARVQVAYFTDFFQTETYRNHELLDGIWTMGVDHYPQLGKFYDHYSESLEQAEGLFNHDESLAYIVELLRKFKPQVVVSHDVNGEYGHGGHMYVTSILQEALEISNDANKLPNSASTYGTWDVPKTYLHLYNQNPIEMKTREALADFDGKNALTVAKEAYKKHGSQQWMWFYVDDGYDENGNPNDYEYSCAKYGLYRTTVGADTNPDGVLDNIVTYAVQEKKAEEESRRAEQTDPIPDKDKETNKAANKTLVIVLIAVAVLIIIFFVIFLLRRKKEKQRREEAARRARARQQKQDVAAPKRRPAPQGERAQEAAQQNRRPAQRPGAENSPARTEQPRRTERPAQEMRRNPQQRPQPANRPTPQRRPSQDGRPVQPRGTADRSKKER